MSEAQGTSSLDLAGDLTAEQVTSSLQNEAAIAPVAMERAYRFLEAIGIYSTVSLDRKTALNQLAQMNTFLRANPAKRGQYTEKVTAAESKVAQTELQESQVKMAVGLRLVHLVKATVQDELESATAAVVQQTEERCRAEAKREIESIRQEHQVQLAQIRKEAAEVAEAAVAKAIENFEKSRTQAAYLMVAEPTVPTQQPAVAPSEAATTTTSNLSQDLANLRAAHNRLSETFEGFSQDAPFKMKKVARQMYEELNGDSAEGSGTSRLLSMENMLYEALTNLNERVVQVEASAAASAAAQASTSTGPSATNADASPDIEPSSASNSAQSRNNSSRRGPAASSQSQRIRPDGTLPPFWSDPSPAGFEAARRQGYDTDGDIVKLLDDIAEMQKGLDWLMDQMAEVWALVQMSHYCWGVDRLSVREFVRVWLTGIGDKPGAPESGASASNGHPSGSAVRRARVDDDDDDDDDGGVMSVKVPRR